MPISLQSLLPFLPPEKPFPIVPSPPQTLSLNRNWTSQPARTLSISVDDRDAAMRTCFPALACANLLHFKSGYYNVEVAVGEDEPEEVLLRRFRRAVMKTGIIREFRRRMFFENAQAKKKRKSREAVLKNRNWSHKPKSPSRRKQKKLLRKASMKKSKEEDEEDNWELPEGELSY
ncbi:30S ribosomal protein S21, chloroplastic-like [Dioscorea cayenensis subsp. rotundata]|uniref:30S ribosomal protein S21, chloroplastic-like n=1 Tax=Dioscorea cayennensis subsp. rotundata TaxID=55577 RepID=A0AB40B2Y3_DIOCR|nr:30S ribosomal protein S21, chloroplastic-like [Dioscorea cayenensis subsp. rotundata]